MAIEKKLIHFNKKEDFQSKLNNNEIKDSSIVFVKDANMIYTHGEEYRFIEWGYLGTVGSPEPPVQIPEGYVYAKPMGNDWWVDSEDNVILVIE